MQNINFSIKTKLFTLFTIVIIASVSCIGWFGFDSAKNAYMQSATLSSKAEIKSLANQIKGLLDTVPEDVVYNEGFYALEKLLVWEDLKEPYKIKEWRGTYKSALIDYLKNKKLYYQVRLLDKNGYEKLVLKYDESSENVRDIQDDQLQNKFTSEYFKQAINLKDGEFYISIMNLNIEQGIVERPFIPVVRYSTPIIDTNGETKGVLVLNFSANKILNMIKNLKIKDKLNKYDYFLLNENGDYLYTKNIDKRWGFQLGRSYKFQNDFGIDTLNKFKDVDKMTIHNNGKIISTLKIYPNKEGNPNRFWYLVNTIDNDVALSSLDEFIQIFFIILVLVLLIGLYLVNRYVIGLTNPLFQITSQLKALSQGEIKKNEIIYNSNDEIGQIVKSSSILISAIETTINQANAVASGDFTKDIKLLGENDQLGLAILNMTKRLKEISVLAKKLSVGNYDAQIIAKSSEDELGLALIQMIKYLENITKVAESISVGEIDVKYKVQGKDDRLGFAIDQMVTYLQTILKQANSISNNDFSNSIETKGNSDELGFALVTMTDMLRASYTKNKEEIWFSDGIGEFGDKLTGLDDTIVLSKQAIQMLSRYVEASSGVIYTYDNNNEELNLVSSFAFVSRDNLSNKFKIGEGIIGQVALEKEPILLKNIRNGEFEVQSGTTISHPKEVFAFPLIHEGELFGVAEIMKLESFTKLDRGYLIKASNIFATALHTTSQNVQIKTLLQDSQKAFEELQSQSEEMQAQSEELRVSNEQMEEQAHQLEMQSANLRIKNVEIEKAKEEIDVRAKELESSNQYKSEFLANMSHELRTPLNSVILLSSLLSKNAKENLNDSDIQKANVINESGNELLRLINDILDLSKIESGKMELIIDKIDTNELIHHYDEVFSHTALDKNLEFKVVDNFKGVFYNDKDRLGQVIRNLISNALKFTKEGSVTLEVSNNTDIKTNQELPIRVSVIDTGMGIPKHKQELIFKAFTQADGSTSRQFGGTGLGLSISTQLSKLMQGKIELNSIESQGATFSILLPSLEDNYDEPSSTTSMPKVIKSSDEIINKIDHPNMKNEQFLIIEDDKSFANVLKETVQEHGAKVFVAHNGYDGLKLAKEHKIDGAIIDIGLPDMSGMDVIKKLKSDELTENIPIQVISGIDRELQDFSELQIDGYLQKPVSSEQISNAILNIKLSDNHESKSILIVEDDELHLKAITDYILEENDYDITPASTIEQASQICQKKYFDIAIVDLGLKDGNGADVCKCISSSKKDTAILIYTGRDLSIDEADFLNDISDEIIIKNPNSHERLKDEIERFLKSPGLTVNDKFKERINKVEYVGYDVDLLKDKKVLIVDDDIKNIFVLSSALQEHDMEVSHAKNGKEALEYLKENLDTHIVLMDIMMPVMNGYEAMTEIRSNAKLKHLPVIAVTAKAMQKDKEEALNSGADDYLTKPIDLEKLISMIAMWINK